MLLRLAAGTVLFASFLPCQGGENTDVRNAEREADRRVKAQGQPNEKGEKGEKSEQELEAEKNLTPEQRLARNVISGAAQHCRLTMSVHPPKLLPGQSGTVKVLATMQGNVVLPSPAPFEVVGPAQQGMISLGSFRILPAAPGRLASGYLGRPVYDNYAVIEIPVTMSPQAQIGTKQVVAVDVKFDLYEGTSTQPISRFLDRVSTEVEVGKPLDPVVQGWKKSPAVPAELTPAPPPKAELAGHATTAPDASGLQANAVPAAVTEAPAAAPSAPISAPPSLPVEDAGSEVSLPLLIGGGALLLGVVLLLARRK
jgi:hypothetical protein